MKRFPLLLIILALAVAAIASKPSDNDRRNERADRALAAYAYYRSQAVPAEHFTEKLLLNHTALLLDPADIDAAGTYARLMLMAGEEDSASVVSFYNDIKRQFFAAPDEFNGYTLFSIAGEIPDYHTALAVKRTLARLNPDRTDMQLDFASTLALTAAVTGDSTRLDSAFAIYDAIEAKTGPDASLIARRAWAQNLSGGIDTAGIVADIQRYVAAAPDDPDVLHIAGMLFKAVNMPDSTLAYFDRACDADSTLGQAFLDRANLLLALGDSTRYAAEVVNVLRSPSIEFADKYEMLRSYTANLYGDTAARADIAAMYDMMQDIHPGESELHRLHGAFLLAVDEPAAAAEQLGYAVALDPTDFDASRLLMSADVAAGDTVEAIAVGRHAARHFTDNLYFPIMTASLLMLRDDYNAALEELDAFDTSEFSNPEGMSQFVQTRADILYKLELTDSAIAEYGRAIALDPTNSMAMNNMAYFMAVDGRDLDRAQSLIIRALDIDKDNPTLLDTYAWVLFKKKDYQGAKLQIDLALAQYADTTYAEPDDKPVIIDETDSPEELEAEEAEVEQYIIEVEREEASADILDHAGDIYFMVGEPAEALEFWKRAQVLDPDNKKIARKVKYKTYFFDDDTDDTK